MADSRRKRLLVVVAPLSVAALATTMVLVVMLPTPPPRSSSAQDAVDLHNAARAEVGVGPLSWNDTLAAYAESYAAQRRGDCQLMVHSGGGPHYGENLFWGAAGTKWKAADVVGSWVDDGKKYYDHGSNSCAAGKECGAYTQVVWARTTGVGCAGVECSNGGGVFAICSYYPRGNLDGQSPY